MSRKINGFAVPSNADVANDSNLFALGDPATGKMFQGTIAQAKAAFSTFKHKYTATGSEGTSLAISEIQGKNIVLIVRESAVIHEVDSAPASAEFSWDDTTITLGAATNPGERFMILYKSY